MSLSAFLTNLFSSLGNYDPKSGEPVEEPASGLHPSLPFNLFLASPEATKFFKPMLTTLHLFFPNELLPALDLLDRGLVSKLVQRKEIVVSDSSHQGGTTKGFYIVRSSASLNRGQSYASHRSDQEDRSQVRNRNLSYEVRLVAWNCTCPAFAFDMVSSLSGNSAWEGNSHTPVTKEYTKTSPGWIYGGLRRVDPHTEEQRKVPICKHLLACLLVERCPALKQYIDEREVSDEEVAGWAAGWGD